MKFGLTQTEYNLILNSVVTPLNQRNAQVYCYGSRARGDHNKFSDLDLMVESDADLQGFISSISEYLTKSSFPYKIDLVQLQNFAEAYKENYNKEKILVIA